MKIVYDDLTEFAEVRLRCENTRKKKMCKYCPFYNRCQIDDDENLHVMCCDILVDASFRDECKEVKSSNERKIG